MCKSTTPSITADPQSHTARHSKHAGAMPHIAAFGESHQSMYTRLTGWEIAWTVAERSREEEDSAQEAERGGRNVLGRIGIRGFQ